LSPSSQVFFSSPHHPSTQPPTEWVPGTLSPGVKWPGREADHSPPTSAKVKKIWICTSTPPCSLIGQHSYISFILGATTLYGFWPAHQVDLHLFLTCAHVFQLTILIAWMSFITLSIHLIFGHPIGLEAISFHVSLFRHSLYMT
jgi:hypothetical protein